MRSRHLLVVPLALAALAPFAGTAGASPAPSTPSPGSASSSAVAHRNSHVCSAPAAGQAGCAAIRHDGIDRNGKPTPNATPSGYGPADIRAAYALGGTASGGRTVAIVDAYDDPNAAADLSTYRSAYGLPACTTASGCFTKVDQTGGTTLPKADGGWAQEISLDLDMVSAACPDCKILLVEATTPSFANLGTAVNTAARLGATAISNSYGGSDSSASSAYSHPGIAVVASTGDAGYGIESPASYPSVVAVGGTSLTKTATGYTEAAWSGAGSGCSTLNAKPAWQTAATSCSGKANADVSAVADPNTGVAVYDSYAYQGTKGWLVFGGTSASSPVIGSVYAIAGDFGTAASAASFTWAHTTGLHDVTSGSNGSCPTPVWCTSGAGWDGPTGLGTPNGLTAF